ncbi:MAG TPA: hypothetical protein VN654_01985 [Vicinamibacterales bacterium]|jgi:hypothetical protein|nr:hypothetical protein [Vicinamibacterales bacterium]
MTYAKHVFVIPLLILFVAPPSSFAKQGRGRGHAKGHDAAVADETVVIDRDGHRRIVHDYYTANALPPGLAKRESLPPGLAKQLRERGELPPGLQKRMTPVPTPLAVRLPRVPTYYSRYFAGNDLLIVDNRSNRIVSLIPNVF